MPQSPQKGGLKIKKPARASRRDVAGRLGSLAACVAGAGGRSRWPARGMGVGRARCQGRDPPKTRAQPLESLLSSTPQAVRLPHRPQGPGGSCFQTSAFPRVARSNSFILGEQRVLDDPPHPGPYPSSREQGGCICPGHAIHSPDVFCAIEAPSFH